jgi:hypothetical protein
VRQKWEETIDRRVKVEREALTGVGILEPLLRTTLQALPGSVLGLLVRRLLALGAAAVCSV